MEVLFLSLSLSFLGFWFELKLCSRVCRRVFDRESDPGFEGSVSRQLQQKPSGSIGELILASRI